MRLAVLARDAALLVAAAETVAAKRLLHHLYSGKVDWVSIHADRALDRSFGPGQPVMIVNPYLDDASYSALAHDRELFHPQFLLIQEGLALLERTVAQGAEPADNADSPAGDLLHGQGAKPPRNGALLPSRVRRRIPEVPD